MSGSAQIRAMSSPTDTDLNVIIPCSKGRAGAVAMER
jgi:hypothetical protein